MNLSPGSISLYCFLLSGLETFDPSVRWAARKLNVSNNTVLKYYTELESRNIIHCYKKGYVGCVSKWEFVGVDKWIIL